MRVIGKLVLSFHKAAKLVNHLLLHCFQAKAPKELDYGSVVVTWDIPSSTEYEL